LAYLGPVVTLGFCSQRQRYDEGVLTFIDARAFSGELSSLLPSPEAPGTAVAAQVRTITEAVRNEGDAALFRFTQEFDGASLDRLDVTQEELQAAKGRIDPSVLHALEVAYKRIFAYHAHEMSTPETYEDGTVTVRPLSVPVDRAGCYAPGGLARYPSSVLMCVAPARVAGVDNIALCIPPDRSGRIDDVSLAAAAVAGVSEVYALGGAQAIAALALGTETIPRVDVIVGPGNSYVAEAKRQLSGEVGVASSFAGPSEVVVIADGSTRPELAAIDLMVQAEHGPDGMAWLITWDEMIARNVDAALERLIAESPRKEQLLATMEKSGVCVLVDSPAQAVEVSNIVAPEHLELLVDDYSDLVELIRNAGAVFCGQNAPASLGDYAVGPNHILPTNRSARFASSLRADDFLKHIHVVEVSPEGFDELAPTVIALAQSEGLAAHVDSIRFRQ